MASRTYYFHVAMIKQGGSEKLYALGGSLYGSGRQKTVEEWEEQTSTWKTADSLEKNTIKAGGSTAICKMWSG